MSLQNAEPYTETLPDDFDIAAFEADLVDHMSFLRASATAMAGRQLAEDLAQVALAKAWQSRHTFLAGSNFKAWLFTILRNEFYSHRRRAWRQVSWEIDFEETVEAPRGEQQWAAELSDTARAIRCLPEDQRNALFLVAVGGFTYIQAAELSNIAVGTMKSRVARGRQALRRLLNGRTVLPVEARPAHGNSMNEIHAELSQLSPNRVRRAGAGAP